MGPAASVEGSGQLVQLKRFIWTDGVEGQGQYNEAYGKSWQMLDGSRWEVIDLTDGVRGGEGKGRDSDRGWEVISKANKGL